MSPREAILVALFLGRQVKRTPSGMWRWVDYPKDEPKPTLADPHVSLLFQAAYVTEQNGMLQLTQTGRIVASKVEIT